MPLSKIELWDSFCSKYKVLETGVPLFDDLGGNVSTFQYGKDQRWMLKRSLEMEDLVIKEVDKIIKDYTENINEYEGLIYIMYWNENQRIIPLYIGKAEKFGKKDKNLSANISHKKGFFARWGYNYDYHIGDLSAVVCIGHDKEKIDPKYIKWAEKIFIDWPSLYPKLKRQTYFWMQAWRSDNIGIWQEFGVTNLTFLEYLLIGVANSIFSEYLLNEEGVNRK